MKVLLVSVVFFLFCWIVVVNGKNLTKLGKSKEEIEKITDPEFKLGFTADGIVLQK